MRISDLSSDVCSSDLEGSHPGVRRREVPHPVTDLESGVLDGDAQAVDRPAAAARQQVPARPQHLMHGTPVGLQIVRASCRERVGQYVLISDVVVSFNTNVITLNYLYP